MPGFGHLEIRAKTNYFVSKKKVAHTQYCRYANNTQKQLKTHAKILNNMGYKLCKVCEPLTLHETLLEDWTPEIETYVTNIIKDALEDLPLVQNFATLDDLELLR